MSALRTIFLSTTVGFIASPLSALAQPAGSPPEAAGQQAVPTVEEVVVTALKRAESVQDVAATVAVLGGDQLQEAGVTSVQGLQGVVPGLIIQRPPNNSLNASIRGLGTSPGPVSFDQSVGLFIDGVYVARGAEFLSSLFDVDRVEVVKGTQSAVLGKNTSLGAIAVTTRKPGDTFSVDARAEHEFEFESDVVSAGVDLPLAENFALRIAGQYQDLGGQTLNRMTGDNVRRTKDPSARITARWLPSDTVDATLSYQYDSLKSTGIPAELIRASGPAVLTLYTVAGRPDLYEAAFDYRQAQGGGQGTSFTRQPSHRVTGTVDWTTGLGVVSSITGWSKFTQTRFTDNDQTPGGYNSDNTRIFSRQYSQELRLTSPSDQTISYIVGATYLNNKLDQVTDAATNYPAGITGPVAMTGEFIGKFLQRTDTASAYGQVRARLSPQWAVTADARYTTERKRADLQRTVVRPGPFSLGVNPPYPLTHLTRRENILDGSLNLEFHPTEQVMVYASVGQGTKGGGYTDVSVPATAEYKKEVARTVEVGVRTEAADRSWRLNLSAFNTDVKDFQNNFFNGVVFIVQNLDLRSRGVDFDGYWRPVEPLTFHINGTYADAINKDAAPGVGKTFPRSPKWAGQAGVTYERPLTDSLQLTLAGDVAYRSSITHQINPAAVPRGEDYTRLNARVEVSSDDGWAVALVGRNLNDDKSLSFAFPLAFTPPGNVIGLPEERRTIALQVSLRR